MDYSLTISGNTLYINPDERLVSNRQYTVTIASGVSGYFESGLSGYLAADYEFWFTSIYCPIFTTIGRVKLDAGPSADDMLDDTIYRMIHKNSLDVVDLYNVANNTTYAYDNWGCDWQAVPWAFKRYVECKAAYDILSLIRYMQTSGSTGGQLKTLGDMTIRYSGDTGGAGDDPTNRMKLLYDCWNELLKMLHGAIRPAVRGYFDVSKAFGHPVREPQHNRVVRPVVYTGYNRPRGPWQNSPYWRGWVVW